MSVSLSARYETPQWSVFLLSMLQQILWRPYVSVCLGAQGRTHKFSFGGEEGADPVAMYNLHSILKLIL
jgi:hypothetical protein